MTPLEYEFVVARVVGEAKDVAVAAAAVAAIFGPGVVVIELYNGDLPKNDITGVDDDGVGNKWLRDGTDMCNECRAGADADVMLARPSFVLEERGPTGPVVHGVDTEDGPCLSRRSLLLSMVCEDGFGVPLLVLLLDEPRGRPLVFWTARKVQSLLTF
jgi:hypothetical protein